MKSRRETYAHLLQRLGQNVASFLLVDKDDDGRLEAVRQHLQQLLPAMHKSQRTHYYHYHNCNNKQQ